ncbi:DUF4179 domain-containing protein [Brevibacillus borstelensis]|uniref:DUF4179 domain-containing protein n=1 Tax=Brevibacillus borstelensis TaxID=45462 RepID=UPI0030C255DD
MKKLPVQTETRDLEDIRQAILQIDMPVSSYSDNIMKRLGEKHQKNHKRNLMKKALAAASTAAALGVFIIGSGFVSPAMAESLKRIPMVNSVFELAGDWGLRTADEKGLSIKVLQSNTHEGITLSVPEVINDGTRFAIGVHREAPGLTSYLNGVKTNADGTAAYQPESTKGAIKQVDLFVNGKPLNVKTDSLAHQVIPVVSPGADKNSAIIMFSDLSNNGLGDPALPDEFDLTVKLTLDGVQEPFNMEIPVKKNTKNNIVLSPDVTREFDHIRITLEKAELTPITTRLAIVVDGTSEKIPKKYRADKGISAENAGLPSNQFTQTKLLGLNYDLFDDQGNIVSEVSGFGHDEKRKGLAFYDLVYEPFKQTPKFFTLKPYFYVLKDQSKISGEYLYDSNGEPVKVYMKELEMTIPVTK